MSAGRRGRDVYRRGNPRASNEPEVLFCPELSLALPKKPRVKHKEEVVHIDGSMLEGGGQILRMSAALSCILAQPISISKIRACRPKPGLSAQHLAGLKLVALVCEGELENAVLRATEISLVPACIRSGEFSVDVRTAGSVCLLLQTALPCLLFAPSTSHLSLKGGTDADFAPPIDYFRHTFTHYASKFGVQVAVQDVMRGFNPKGGGEVRLSVEPLAELQPVEITDRGHLSKITVTVYICGTLSSSLAERCLHTAESIMKRRFTETRVPVQASFTRDDRAFGNGWGLHITAQTSTGCRLTATGNGNSKISPEKLASATAEHLIRDIDEGGCVDAHMQDQLIILMALAQGTSRVRTGPLSLHTKTAIHVVEKMCEAQFSVTKDGNCNLGEQTYLVECKGIGLRNPYFDNVNDEKQVDSNQVI